MTLTIFPMTECVWCRKHIVNYYAYNSVYSLHTDLQCFIRDCCIF